MSRHEQMCPHCQAKAGLDEAETPTAEPQPIELPDGPTPIRVHRPDLPPFDCTLHPDGTLTAVFGSETRRNLVSFAEMREQGWRHAHIEFNPPPLEELEPEPGPAVVQDAIPLAAA